nr:cytochrome P450 6a8-like [Leptinotarsa decemlineata]
MFILPLLSHLVIVIVFLILVLIAFYKWSFLYWKRRNIPFLEPSIPFGSLMNMLTRKISRIEELTMMYNECKKRGYKHCGIWQLADPTYFVVDLELLKNICIKDFEHFVDRGFYFNEKDDPISAHLLSLDGDRWKTLRKQSSTIFSGAKLKGMFPNVLACAESLENYVASLVENGSQPVNVKDIASSFAVDSVGSSTLGIKCRGFTDPDKKFIHYSKQALETDRKSQLRMLFGIFFPNAARKMGMRQQNKDIGDFFTNVICDTVQKRKAQNVERNDFLQLLMNLKNKNEISSNGPKLTMNNVAALSFGLFIGGFETSTSSFTFCMFELASHQNIQDKVREEVKTVLARHNNEFSYESLGEMKYLRQVLDENWRLHPPAHTINRRCTKDYKVPGEDLIIEKGTNVLVTITGIHRDPEYYPNPLVFDPDRFSEENKKKIPPFAFIPFGAGPRICIGERFGIMQVKLALANIILKYRVTLDKKTITPIRLLPSPMVPVVDGGVWVNFEKL